MEGECRVFRAVGSFNIFAWGGYFLFLYRFDHFGSRVMERLMDGNHGNPEMVQSPRRFIRACRVYYFFGNFGHSIGQVRFAIRRPNSPPKFCRSVFVTNRLCLFLPVEYNSRTRVSSDSSGLQVFLGSFFRFLCLYVPVNWVGKGSGIFFLRMVRRFRRFIAIRRSSSFF